MSNMKSKFPFSMENIPRQKSFACLSLKLSSIVSALIIILYSIFSLAQCFAAFSMVPEQETPDDYTVVVPYTVVVTVTVGHIVTLFLTTLMLIGVLREKPRLLRPWVVWTSIQVIIGVVMFVFWSAMNVINHYPENLLIYVIEFLSLMIRFYMLMLVSSFYKQLEEDYVERERLKDIVNSETWYSSA